MKLLTTAFLSLFLITACSEEQKTTIKPEPISLELGEATRLELIQKTEEMAILDQKYRTPISVGTLDETVLEKNREISKSGTIEEYMAFNKTIEKTLSEDQIDSLWDLQHALDYENFMEAKTMITKHGYPSDERLKTKTDKIFPILLHPPVEIEPQNYLDEMILLLKPEVKQGRMEAKLYSIFVDNILTKILKKPQVYGTVKYFDRLTMSEGKPKLINVDETNQARTEIGLPELIEGEFELVAPTP